MKPVYRLSCADTTDLDGVQRWLEDMSAQGLHLQRWGNLCKFQRGEPKRVRYRLDPDRDDSGSDLSQAVKDSYQELGWRYVCPMTTYFYIFACEDPTAPELYTDPDSLVLAMKRVVRSAWFDLTLHAAILLIYGYYFFHFLGPLTVLGLVQSFSPFLPLCLLLCAPMIPYIFLSSARLLRIHRALKRDGTLPRSPVRRRGSARFFSLVSILLLVMLLCEFGMQQLYNTESRPQPLDAVTFSIPSLSQLEQSPDFVLTSLDREYMDQYYDRFYIGRTPTPTFLFGSNVQRQRSFLAPVQYRIYVEGEVPSLLWSDLVPGDTRDPYAPSLSIRLWDLWSGRIAGALVNELRANLDDDYADAQAVQAEGCELALLYPWSDGSGQTLLLHRGNRVAKISYSGVQSLESQLPACAAMMAEDWRLSPP